MLVRLKAWAKRGESPLARRVFRVGDALRRPQLPVWRPLHLRLYHLHLAVTGLIRWGLQAVWFTPLFQARLEHVAPALQLTNGMPQILGPLAIQLGRNCRVNGASTWTGRATAGETPRLEVGDNVTLGWRGVVSVGSRVTLGSNVLLASDVHIAGYPGHPLDPIARAKGLPEAEEQVGDVVIEDDVWIGAGCFINAGVRIGRGTVVAAHSVVTKDLPAMVVAAGVPAKPIRPIYQDADNILAEVA